MSESALETTAGEKRRISLGERFRNNPVVVKEMRARMRGNRAFVLLTIYLGLLSLLVALVYLAFTQSASAVNSISDRQVFGKAIFGIVVFTQLLTISFVSPALTAGAISTEREHQTYDLLRTTLLTSRALVLGKFFSGLLFVLLMLFAALPLQSLAFLFGGVAVEEFIIATILLVVSAIAFCAAGVFFSSFIKRTLISTVLAYAFAIILVFGFPMLLLLVFGLLDALFGGFGSQLSTGGEIFLFVGGWLLVSLNPLATAVATEAILLEEQSAFLFSLPLPSGITVTLISPWVPYVIIFLILSLVLLWLSIRFVRRVEK
jgi:ABC-type transport system involved in multi-copper enzyme maturation permease subunit